MGLIYKTTKCKSCGYKPHEKWLSEGCGFAYIFREIAFCRNCHEVSSIYVGPEHLVQKHKHSQWQSAEEYIKWQKSRDAESLDSLEFDTCTLCKSKDIELLELIKDFKKDIAWMICPRCQEGKIKLTLYALWD